MSEVTTLSQNDFQEFKKAKAKFAKAQAEFTAAKAKIPSWYFSDVEENDSNGNGSDHKPLTDKEIATNVEHLVILLNSDDYKKKGATHRSIVAKLRAKNINLDTQHIKQITESDVYATHFTKELREKGKKGPPKIKLSSNGAAFARQLIKS